MRDDLLHAQASVDWAVAQLPSFQSRLDAWSHANVDVIIKELPADSPNNVIVAIEKGPLPLAFQVEVGAYINAIRSSLDILASALAARHCQALMDDAYFPVASSPQAFAARNYKGSKFVQALPAKERDIIESIKPYKGGNPTLYPLHHLDIVRKHVRLLSVLVQPARLGMRREAMPFFQSLSIAWMRSSDEETVLGLISKDAPNPELDFTATIGLDEPTYSGRGVMHALQNFATFAGSIIWMFDSP
jgi:hypothetical protein